MTKACSLKKEVLLGEVLIGLSARGAGAEQGPSPKASNKRDDMQIRYILPLLSLVLVACSGPQSDPESKAIPEAVEPLFSQAEIDLGRSVYLENCAACHGRALEGGLGTALVKTDWAYGRDSFSIGLSIQNGIPTAGMPAFGELLTQAQRDAVVSFILSSQTGPLEQANPIPEYIETPGYKLKVERLVEKDLDVPWGIEFVDDHRALITENSGQLFWMIDGVLDRRPIEGVPTVDLATSTGGLLDIAVDPNYSSNGWIYLAYSHSADPEDVNANGMTKILRARIDAHKLVDKEVLFSPPESEHRPNSKHWGGRMLFDREGMLYFSVGDMSQPDASQDPERPTGKIHRMHSDGTIPADNPFVDQGPVAAYVYSLGNRNVQGIAQQPATGEIWATEHGPHGGDELNIIRKGANYGWPITTYGVNYDGSKVSDLTEKDGINAPVRQWTPALAIGAAEFVKGDLFKDWEGDLLVGSLSREALLRLEVTSDSVVTEEVLFKGYGRIRDLKMGPDGALYVLFNNPGLVVRITPVPGP